MFRVVWQPSAKRELAAIWTAVEDRQSVTNAAQKLDKDLSDDPMSVGESRFAGIRITFEAPLAIEFHVSESAHVVSVLVVRWFGAGGRSSDGKEE